MKITPLQIPDVFLIEPDVFEDERGFFFESFNQNVFEKLTGIFPTFVQDNHSKSTKDVLRGLHYQLPPKAQDKLVRVVLGEVFDVAVDIREFSPTFGQWTAEILSADNKKQLWIPAGFAHGFQVISEEAEVLYKTTCYWSKQHENTIAWADPHLKIKWPLASSPIISEKDHNNAISFIESQPM
jgi:dTDP-4-dehydrorhamnose 3,5-epimerase